jgi:OOP family OmpA-OmpF porin
MKSRPAATLGSFVFLMTLLAGSAWSQEAGIYIGGAIGRAEYRNACEGVTISCDHIDNAVKIFAGYQFNRYFAAEIGYADLGKSSANGVVSGVNVNATAESVAWELVGVASLPVIDGLSLYGKLGFYRAETKVSGTGAIPGFSAFLSESDRNSDATYGLGARYGITRNLALRAEWQRYVAVGGPDVGDNDIDVFGVGLMYRF